MPAVQKRAFPLAGLMCTLRGIAHAHEGKAGITVPANASSSFSRRGNEESLRPVRARRFIGGHYARKIFPSSLHEAGRFF